MEKACDTVGARSISDFARTAAIRLINSTEDGGEMLKAKLSQIDQFIDRLQGRVQAMADYEPARQPMPHPSLAAAVAEEHL
ncbi:MAG: hypothetical protein WA324_15135 [Bryobacteraceae bacterium]